MDTGDMSNKEKYQMVIKGGSTQERRRPGGERVSKDKVVIRRDLGDQDKDWLGTKYVEDILKKDKDDWTILPSY